MGFYLFMWVLVKCLLSLLTWKLHEGRDLTLLFITVFLPLNTVAGTWSKKHFF